MLNLSSEKPFIFLHISGPGPTRRPLTNLLMRAFKRLDSEIQYAISEGRPGGNTFPQKISDSGWYFEWCPIRDELFSLCDALVIRGRACINFSVDSIWKTFLVYSNRKSWRIDFANSDKVSGVKNRHFIETTEFDSDSIKKAMLTLIGDEQYRRNVSHLMRGFAGLNGVQNILKEAALYL